MAVGIRAVLRNGLLALLSGVVALVACEVALRLLHPRYELAANPPEDRPSNDWLQDHPDTGMPHPGSWSGSIRSRLQDHPDTGVPHRVIRNNLGGRQSRNFTAADLDRAVNIAFFGDSQTENIRMPVQYSYTEALDYLLNVAVEADVRDGFNGAASSGREPRFNVLNFGVGRYGAGRAYLRWRDLPVRHKLTHVFYMVVHNDLDDLRKSIGAGIVRLGESGEILGGVAPRAPVWKRLLAHWHLTYLAIDAWLRLTARWSIDSATDSATGGAVAQRDGRRPSKEETQRVFGELVRRWGREVEADGGVFHLVLLPNPPDGFGGGLSGKWLRPIREDGPRHVGVAVFDLLECFAETIPGFDYRHWRFANDPHWNSAANMVAANCLYRYLEGALGLRERTADELAHARHAYYQAFLDAPEWEGTRYMPDVAWARRPGQGDGVRSPVGTATRDGAIVAKYLALELASAPETAWLRDAYAAGAVATSTWDVYANARERRLAYVKSPCDANWRAGGADSFFLHVVPFTAENLPADRVPSGFVNLDDASFSYHLLSADECVFSVRLPDYPLSRVRTGQYAERREGGQTSYEELWSATFRMPLARSAWDVYASADGRGLEYVKAPCRRADTEPRFYLHVYPLRSADRPAAGRAYANRDFAWDAAGAMEDGACRISAALPEFPIAFVHTGQYRDGLVSRRLWRARVDFAEVERLVPADRRR